MLPTLIVDTDPQVRSLVGRMLAKHGFRNFDAADGERGLSTLQQLNGNVSALITDVELEKMSGIDLAEWARTLVPSLPVIFMASTLTSMQELQDRVPGCEVVPKPFHAFLLLQTIRRALDSV